MDSINSMKKRRNKIEIVHDLLRAIQAKGGSIKPTHLLYKSNLSHNRMREYLDELIQKNLIQEVEQREKKKTKQMIVLAQGGYDFLQQLSKLKEFTEAFGL